MSQFIKFCFTSSMLNMFRTLIHPSSGACHTDTTPTNHTETPKHIETRTHNQCGDTIEKSQAPDDGCINVRNMLNIEEVKENLINCDIRFVSYSSTILYLFVCVSPVP